MAVADPDKVFPRAGVGYFTKGKGIQQLFDFQRFAKMHKGKYKSYSSVTPPTVNGNRGTGGGGICFEEWLLTAIFSVEKDLKQMTVKEIEQQIDELEGRYAKELQNRSGIRVLSTLWHRIKDLQRELLSRKSQ